MSDNILAAVNDYFDHLVKSRFIEMFGKYFNSNEIVLADLCTSIDSGKSYTCGDPRTEVEPAILKLGAVFGGEYNPNENKVVDPDLFKEEFEVKPGDVLFSRKNTYELVGTAAYVWDTPPKLMLPDLIFRINLNDSVNPIYFVKLINHPLYRVRVTSLAHGAASSMPNISKKELLGLGVPLPPITEQNLFADFVRQVDKSKLIFQQLVSQYDELIKSRFIEMFGVREHYSSNWTMCGFDTCCNVIYGHPFDSSLFNETGEGTPLIRIRDINTGFSNTYTTEEVDSQYNVEDGDLLVGMDGDFNAIIWNHGPALLNQRVCKINAKQGVMNPVYLLYCLNPELQQIHSKTSSTTVKHLSAKEIKKIQFPIPSMELQNQFADFVKQVDKSKSNLLCYINMLNNGD